MFDWIKKHRTGVIIGSVISVFILVSLIPLIINLLFKLKSNGVFSAEWTAGEFLQFYGSLLSFISTTILSMLAIWQNKTIKDEADKRTALAEQMELAKNMPKFSCRTSGYSGKIENLRMTISNISENVANDIYVCNTRIVDERECTVWSTDDVFKKDVLPSAKELEIKLKNPPLTQDGVSFRFVLKCKDKYNTDHTYEVFGKCETAENHPLFKVIEIT